MYASTSYRAKEFTILSLINLVLSWTLWFGTGDRIAPYLMMWPGVVAMMYASLAQPGDDTRTYRKSRYLIISCMLSFGHTIFTTTPNKDVSMVSGAEWKEFVIGEGWLCFLYALEKWFEQSALPIINRRIAANANVPGF